MEKKKDMQGWVTTDLIDPKPGLLQGPVEKKKFRMSADKFKTKCVQ